MARNIVAERHNKNYLFNAVYRGGFKDKDNSFYEFEGIDKDGRHDGYTFIYDSETGQVGRFNTYNKDDYFIFGKRNASVDARGYRCVEMCVPYVPDVYPEDSIYYKDGEPVAVQFTCYIHRIALMLKCKLEGIMDWEHIREANHMNGNKMDNRLFNIENSTAYENGLHAAVLNSIIKHRNELEDWVTSSSNKKHTFLHLTDNRLISAKWVKEYMKEDEIFAMQVKEYKRTVSKKNNNRAYIDLKRLNSFGDWLIDLGYWKA